MTWYEEEVQQLEKKIQSTPDLAGRTVFYGSSTIRLWTTLERDFPDKNVLNIGFGGSTLAACDWFFERLVLPTQPRSLIFYAGDNDLGDGRLSEEVFLFFSELVRKMQQHLPDVPFTFVSIKPSPARWHIIDRIRLANDLIRQKIDELPTYHYVDVFTSMLDSKGHPRWDLFEKDGLHLSSKGYALWQQILLQHPHIF
ncbi:lysophospholipase L1-like esterase [Larkinella arboricola]|uniref:Lysophospholipase L1-like esterase n=1 Tax=Larkinella arboricola TaxID=643671 RepID=A0A327WV19_LARAB|nr:SGNH/GDSL hydrolase family protein [Larkinella arboricola]RAJ95536.1 lysophospholipase L1-like esterase [Larkinella arboricola]